MRTRIFVPLLLASLALPVVAQAQGTVRGAEEGGAAGDRAAGPAGAIVGGTVGAATGTIGGILGVRIVRASANMSNMSDGPLTTMTTIFASAWCFRQVLRTTTCPPSTT